LSQLKLNLGQPPAPPTAFQQQLTKLLDTYNFQLATQQLIDFDDLLVKTAELLQQNQRLAKKIGRQYQYILIDEFQDTHPLQYQIVKLITAQQTQPNITVIGDPLQSIYSFRGASSDIFHQFQQDFAGAQIINLTINYRSRPQLISLSHSLFPKSQLLTADLQTPAQINLITTLNEQSESQWIINAINQQLGGTDLNQASDFQHHNQQRNLADFAVIFRTHHLAHTLEMALEKSGIPYQIIGGLSLFEKKELAFLITAFTELLQAHQPTQLNAEQLINQLLKRAKLDRAISQSPRKQQELQTFQQYLAQFTGPDWLAQSVAYFQRLQAHDFYDERADRVTLLTMHAAKGLEFCQVFLIGFEADLIPHQKRLSEAEIAEEKRLLYVALTRAKHGLTILNCQERFRQHRQLSPFAQELDMSLLNHQLDPQIAKILKYRKKAVDKKRQMSLF